MWVSVFYGVDVMYFTRKWHKRNHVFAKQNWMCKSGQNNQNLSNTIAPNTKHRLDYYL